MPMKEHRLSPMREEPLSAPGNEDCSQNMGTGGGGCPGSVGSAGSNKKPRSRTKVELGSLCSGPMKGKCFNKVLMNLSTSPESR